jgi:hypothetical protein
MSTHQEHNVKECIKKVSIKIALYLTFHSHRKGSLVFYATEIKSQQ